MNERETRNLIGGALERLIYDEPELLQYDVNERSITHRLAVYLTSGLTEEWDVDVEYNRVGVDEMSKEISMERLDSIVPDDVKKDDLDAKTVYPDIIVHHRGEHRENLLAIEAKKSGRVTDYDKEKLTAYVEELEYDHGVFVELFGMGQDEMPDVCCEWYPFD